MDELQFPDFGGHRELNVLNITDLVGRWLDQETNRQVDHTRTHPPLLSGDQLSIGGTNWTVFLVNDATFYTEWPQGEPPTIPMLSDFSNHYTPSRAVAVVYPGENKKQTHYLVFGRKAIGKKQYESSFQLVPVDDETRAKMIGRPEADLITKLFVRGREPTKLEEDTEWLQELSVQPITDITIIHKNQIPEPEITAFTKLRIAVIERDRMYKAWREAWKFFPGAAFLGGAIAAIPSGGSEVTSFGLIGGSAVGLSTVLFQKTLEFLNRDLNKLIREQQNRPAIRRLATLKFSDQGK